MESQADSITESAIRKSKVKFRMDYVKQDISPREKEKRTMEAKAKRMLKG